MDFLPDNADGPTAQEAVDIDMTESVELLLRDLRSSKTGLSTREAERRQIQYGPNELRRRGGLQWPRELARQLTHPLALLLWLAAALSFAVGSDTVAIAVLLVIALNALFAFVQEMQAERAVEALAQFLPQHVTVLRGGKPSSIVAVDLVPGDVVVVEEGDRIAADMRLISGAVEVDLSTLTGESAPALRSAELIDAGVPRIAARDLLFSGTSATGGEARAVVFATGMHTELGRIAALSERVKEEPSPLERQVRRVAWLIAGIAVTMAVAFVPVAIFGAGLSFKNSVVFAVGLLAGNVPEGLLPVITLALAVAVRGLARRGALVKRLSAVETLGSTDVICTDKTGTLTENRMSPVAAWTLAGETELDVVRSAPHPDASLVALGEAGAVCNNARMESAGLSSGDPTEVALLTAAGLLGVEHNAASRERGRIHQYNFDPQRKLMSTLDAAEGRDWLHTKGAPESVLPRCTSALSADGEEHPLQSAERELVTQQVEGFAGQGLRVLALARRSLPSGTQPPARDEAESELCFLGLVTMRDPPRAEVIDAVARCHSAGVRIVLITGDHPLTAAAIARQVGIGGEDPLVVNAQAFDHKHEQEVKDILAGGREVIFARASPETKLQIAEALRGQGHVVAMTGDGVNDAPALRRADIGVAMGRSGTDVAREASTMILTDDNFATIVVAIEAGRQVYDNVRKFIQYIFAHATPEVAPFLVFALAGGADPAATHGPSAARLRRRLRDTAVACAGPRPDRAWQHGPPTTLALGGRDPGPDARARLAVPRRDGRRPVTHRVLLRSNPSRMAPRRPCRGRASTASRLPTGHHDDLRRDDRRADRHRLRCANTTGIAAVDRRVQQSLPARRHRGRAAARRGIRLRATAAVLLGTAGLPVHDLAFLLPYPFIVWGADELRRWLLRRHATPRARS